MTAMRTEHLAEGVVCHLGDCLEILPTLGKHPPPMPCLFATRAH
jgi:hypothetical protein